MYIVRILSTLEKLYYTLDISLSITITIYLLATGCLKMCQSNRKTCD
jgi:hypothetical protein